MPHYCNLLQAFPKGSALTPLISMALLNLTGGGEMHAFKTKNFGPEYSDGDYSFDTASRINSIRTRDLAGLFVIGGTLATLAVLLSTPWFEQRFMPTRKKSSTVHSAAEPGDAMPPKSDENSDSDHVIDQD